MKLSLHIDRPHPLTSPSPPPTTTVRSTNHRILLPSPAKSNRLIRRRYNFSLKAATVDSAKLHELHFSGDIARNPAISTAYRNPELRIPNRTVLDAQARVCTGPTQTKPLSEEQAFEVLRTILKSARGELKDDYEVSKAQLGAFFAGMTIRANAFPEATQWSEGERRAMNALWPELVRALPHDVLFIADPEGSIMGVSSSVGPHYTGQDTREMRLVGALREVLAGGHLGYEEVNGVLKDVLPGSCDNESTGVLLRLLM